MKSIANTAEDVTHIPTAKQHNTTAFAKSGPNGNIPDGSGESKTPIYFSWDLAIKINPKQPDITASVALYGLYTWQGSSLGKQIKRFAYAPYIDGKRYCYRSSRELEKEYSLADGSRLYADNTILNALNRASNTVAPDFLIARKYEKADRGKLHYHLSDELIQKYKFNKPKKNGLTKFYLKDAIKYGELGGVLLANMDHQIETFKGALTDEAGNKYGELSPTKLTEERKAKDGSSVGKIIPKNYETVADAIRTMLKDGAIVKHPDRKGFYRRSANTEEVSSGKEELSSHTEELSRRFDEKDYNVPNNRVLQQISTTPDSNTDRNPDRKCLLTETSPLRSHVSVEKPFLSPGAEKLMSLVANDMTSYRTRLKPPHFVPNNSLEYHKIYNVVDYGKVECIGYDLLYDFIPLDVNTNKPYSRKAEIDYTMDQLINDFKVSGFVYTKNDLSSLRQLFVNHPLLTYDHIHYLLVWCEPKVEPLYIGNWNKPKKAWDDYYFARRVQNLKQFLRYLPQIIREYYVGELSEEYEYYQPPTGIPEFDYSGMPEPFLSIAFRGDTKNPVTHKQYDVEHEVLDESNWLYKFGLAHPELAAQNPGRYGPVYKYTTTHERRPVFYDEFIGTPTREFVEHENNPMEFAGQKRMQEFFWDDGNFKDRNTTSSRDNV